MATRTLRVLVLHGFGQSHAIIRHQTGALRRAVRPHRVLFEYMNAPHELAGITAMRPGQMKLIEESGMETVDRYSWWYGDGNGSLEHYQGFEQSIHAIRAQWLQCADEHHCSGYDGILGFSQGACLAGILASIKHCADNHTLHQRLAGTQYNSLVDQFDFLHSLQFCIIVSGFISLDKDLARLYGSQSDPCTVRTLHVIGRGDLQVEPQRSEQCSQCFAEPQLVLHDGGHHIPMRKEYLSQYVRFIEAQRMQTAGQSSTESSLAHKL